MWKPSISSNCKNWGEQIQKEGNICSIVGDIALLVVMQKCFGFFAGRPSLVKGVAEVAADGAGHLVPRVWKEDA